MFLASKFGAICGILLSFLHGKWRAHLDDEAVAHKGNSSDDCAA